MEFGTRASGALGYVLPTLVTDVAVRAGSGGLIAERTQEYEESQARPTSTPHGSTQHKGQTQRDPRLPGYEGSLDERGGARPKRSQASGGGEEQLTDDARVKEAFRAANLDEPSVSWLVDEGFTSMQMLSFLNPETMEELISDRRGKESVPMAQVLALRYLARKFGSHSGESAAPINPQRNSNVCGATSHGDGWDPESLRNMFGETSRLPRAERVSNQRSRRETC